jgi:hypothetical protein
MALDRLAGAAERLLARIREYEAFAAPEGHAFTVRTNSLLTSAAFAALEAENELQRLGFGPDYPFDGDVSSPSPVVTGPWPTEIFVAIDTLRDFLFQSRRGAPGYGQQAGGVWSGPPVGTKLGEKVFPDFGPWIGRLERAAALLTGPEPQPTLRRFAGKVPLSTEGPTSIQLLDVPLNKEFKVKYLSLHQNGDGALDVELRNGGVTVEWFCVRGAAPPVRISGDDMQLRALAGHPLTLVFPQVEKPTHGIFTVAGLLEPLGSVTKPIPHPNPERMLSQRQPEPEGLVEGVDEGIDIREIPFEAPTGTPSPIREAYDAVAEALRHAWLVRHRDPLTGPAFRDEAKQLSAAYRNGLEEYRKAEIWLRSATDQSGRCAHSDALAAVSRINDACGHVMLGVVASKDAADHIRAAPLPYLRELLLAMRQQISRAAVEKLTKTGLASSEKPPIAKASDQKPQSPDIEVMVQYVTLDKMAAIVNRDKKTLERRKTRKNNPLPAPAVEGGGGKPDEWIWSNVRPWLEKEFSRPLPEQYPTLRQ